MATPVHAPPAKPAAELHVVPHAITGRWRVARPGAVDALSWHSSTDEATRAARRGAARIYLHDRYQRVRKLEP